MLELQATVASLVPRFSIRECSTTAAVSSIPTLNPCTLRDYDAQLLQDYPRVEDTVDLLDSRDLEPSAAGLPNVSFQSPIHSSPLHPCPSPHALPSPDQLERGPPIQQDIIQTETHPVGPLPSSGSSQVDFAGNQHYPRVEDNASPLSPLHDIATTSPLRPPDLDVLDAPVHLISMCWTLQSIHQFLGFLRNQFPFLQWRRIHSILATD